MKCLRINGIYNVDTIENLIIEGIKEFGFDFRPRSMSFVQAHIVKKILNENHFSGMKYYLQFSNEKDFVIRELINNLFEGVKFLTKKDLVIEYHDISSIDDILPEYNFIWHYSTLHSLTKIKNLPNCKGIVFNEKDLWNFEKSGELYSFMHNLFDDLNEECKIELASDWTLPVVESLLEFYPIKGVVYSINNQVESSYRNINANLLSRYIQTTKKVLESHT